MTTHPTPAATPLVLLDVDGVINDLGALHGMVRPYEVDVVESNGYKVHIPDFMPRLIQRLVATCEVWWCTTWREAANREIAAHLGITALPVVDDGSSQRAVTWKPAAAAPLAATAMEEGRPVVWVEDFYGYPPKTQMPAGVYFVDTAANTDSPVLLPHHIEDWLSGGSSAEAAA